MEVVRFSEAPAYTAANHEAVSARRLQGGEASNADFVLLGHSHFPPGATVPMDVAPMGRIYVVVNGVIIVEEANGVRHELEHLDSIFVPAGESRTVLNDGEVAAAIIVVTPPPQR